MLVWLCVAEGRIKLQTTTTKNFVWLQTNFSYRIWCYVCSKVCWRNPDLFDAGSNVCGVFFTYLRQSVKGLNWLCVKCWLQNTFFLFLRNLSHSFVKKKKASLCTAINNVRTKNIMTTTTKYRICFPPESYINTLVPTKAVCSTHLLEKDREKKSQGKA